MSLKEKHAAIIAELEPFDDPQDRFQYIIDCAKSAPSLPESLRREEFSTHEENSTKAVPVPEVSEEIEDNEISPQTTDTTPANETTLVNDTTSQEEAATQEPCVSSPAAPTAAAPTQQTISDTEKNPRLLAFEQLMKDLGGRIE